MYIYIYVYICFFHNSTILNRFTTGASLVRGMFFRPCSPCTLPDAKHGTLKIRHYLRMIRHVVNPI